MAQELLFTSAPKGLKPGSSGPCVVLVSLSMPPLLMQRLESLSGYRMPHDGLPPIESLSHTLVDMNGMLRHVVSRVASNGFDHAKRPNRLAHHLVLHSEELGLAGPAWLVQQPIFRKEWDGTVAQVDGEVWLPEGPPQPVHLCAAWQTVTGDAGWAGLVAEAALAPAPKPVWIIHRRSVPVINLLDEVLAIVPAKDRWKITFNTHFTQPVNDAQCTLRFCLAGSEAAHAATHAEGMVINLASPGRLERTGGLLSVARSGRASAASQAPATTRVAPVALEPERKGQHVVPMLGRKAPTRIVPGDGHAPMAAVDVGAESRDETPPPRPRRPLPVPPLPWVVAIGVTIWAAAVTIRLLMQDHAAPTARALTDITPSDEERDGLRARVGELEIAARDATTLADAFKARVSELEASLAKERASVASLSAEVAAQEAALAAANAQRTAPDPVASQGTGSEEPVAVSPPAGGGNDAAAPSDVAQTTILKRPQAASGSQRLGAVAGGAIELAWPKDAESVLQWSGDGVVQRATGKRIASLSLTDGSALWEWDGVVLSGLSGDAVESAVDTVAAASWLVDGTPAPVRIDARTVVMQVPRRSLVSKAFDLRSPVRLPWPGSVSVRGQDGTITIEPGSSGEVPVADELGLRGVLVLTLTPKGDRLEASFVPDPGLDQDATRKRLTAAREKAIELALVKEQDALLRGQPAKPKRSVGTAKGRDAYDAFLARHPDIAEKIQRYRTQGLDDLTRQIDTETAAAAAELESAETAVAKADELRAKWPGAIAEVAPRGGQAFVMLRVEATGS